MNENPIGIIDSGVGGLTVWNSIKSALPSESFLYCADTAYNPYGRLSSDVILERSRKMINFLLVYKIKLLVVACNTITVTQVEELRNLYPHLPIVGTVPVVKTAVQKTKNQKIGILSTKVTAESEYQQKLIQTFAQGIDVVNIGSNALVPYIERDEIDTDEFLIILKGELQPFLEKNVDVVALGCTHFPFIRSQIQTMLGNTVTILDSGEAVARQVQRILNHNGIVSSEKQGKTSFFVTGDQNRFSHTATHLMKTPITAGHISF